VLETRVSLAATLLAVLAAFGELLELTAIRR
jgi:hypothetical protein